MKRRFSEIDAGHGVCTPRLVRHQFGRKICGRRASPKQVYNADIWSCIAGFLGHNDLVSLAMAAKFFVPIAMDERLWKALALKRLGIVCATNFLTGFSWKSLYKAAFDGSHFYSIHGKSEHRDWARAGAFTIVSGKALAAGRLWKRCSKTKARKIDESSALCLVSNVKNGIWISDLHLVRCPRCKEAECQGTMQTLEFRHWELFLHDEYQSGSWTFIEAGERKIRENCDAAGGGVFDFERLVARDQANLGILNFKSWVAPTGKYPPVGKTSLFGAAGCSNLEQNKGLLVKFYVMSAGKDGPVVSIRITQQLL